MNTVKTSVMLFVLAALVMMPAAAQRRETAPVSFVKITDSLYQISGGRGANGGVYIGDDCVLMIDAKMDEDSMKQVFAELRALTDKPLRYLVNTHSDGDHVSGNRYFPESTIIVAHENCREEFFHETRDGGRSEWSDPALMKFVPSVTYREKMIIRLGSEIVEMWHFGTGHTTGDAVVYFPAKKIAFIGDQYFEGRPPLIHSYKGGSALGHIGNLERMLETLDADSFVSGHADPVSRADIERHIGEMRGRVEKVESRVIQGDTLADVEKLFDDNEKNLVGIIYNEVKAGM